MFSCIWNPWIFSMLCQRLLRKYYHNSWHYSPWGELLLFWSQYILQYPISHDWNCKLNLHAITVLPQTINPCYIHGTLMLQWLSSQSSCLAYYSWHFSSPKVTFPFWQFYDTFKEALRFGCILMGLGVSSTQNFRPLMKTHCALYFSVSLKSLNHFICPCGLCWQPKSKIWLSQLKVPLAFLNHFMTPATTRGWGAPFCRKTCTVPTLVVSASWANPARPGWRFPWLSKKS